MQALLPGQDRAPTVSRRDSSPAMFPVVRHSIAVKTAPEIRQPRMAALPAEGWLEPTRPVWDLRRALRSSRSCPRAFLNGEPIPP